MEKFSNEEQNKSFEDYQKNNASSKFERIISHKTFENINFADLTSIKFIGCVFKNCDFTSSIISDCLFDDNTKIYDCNFYHTFFDCVYLRSYVDDCSFVGATFRCCDFTLDKFIDCIIVDALSLNTAIGVTDEAILQNELAIRTKTRFDECFI